MYSLQACIHSPGSGLETGLLCRAPSTPLVGTRSRAAFASPGVLHLPEPGRGWGRKRRPRPAGCSAGPPGMVLTLSLTTLCGSAPPHPGPVLDPLTQPLSSPVSWAPSTLSSRSLGLWPFPTCCREAFCQAESEQGGSWCSRGQDVSQMLGVDLDSSQATLWLCEPGQTLEPL